MRNSKNNGTRNNFTIIKKDSERETFEDSNLNGKPLNDGPEDSIEDAYQNVNFEKENDTVTLENISSDVEATTEDEKFKKDIKENGLHDSQIDKS